MDIVDAYRRLLPLIGIWFLPFALRGMKPGWFLLVFLPVPFMQHQLKAYQHGAAFYGDKAFRFVSALGRFYGLYAIGLLWSAIVLLGWTTMFVFFIRSGTGETISDRMWLYGALFAVVMYVLVGPYYATAIQRFVWEHTALGEIRFRTEMRVFPLLRLTLENTALTVLTAGLYWPWAAMALARYRLECMRIEAPYGPGRLTGSVGAPSISAMGDGSLDAFGLDIGL